MTPQSVVLDPQLFSTDLEEIMTKLRARTVGQDHAVEAFGWIFETRSLRPATNKILARTRGRTCSLLRSTLCFGRDMFLLSRLSAFSETDRVFTNSACFVLFNHQASPT